MRPMVLRRRGDFLRVAAAGRKWATPGILVQAAPAPPGAPAGLRYGITASRKVGNAVTRNRAKRRLRALAVNHLPLVAAPGFDYVLIARQATASRPFAALIDDLNAAVSRLKVARPKTGAGNG
ncbi:MAG: ribonuclease P protein component [Sphingomonadales bacterium]|nr:ribonuclease P protein component [Sphingomonadales bacterium]